MIWVASAESDVPAATVMLCAEPAPTARASVPPAVLLVAPRVRVVVEAVPADEVVGVVAVNAEDVPAVVVGADSPIDAVVSAPTVSAKVVVPEVVPSETTRFVAVLENTELLLKLVVEPMLPISVRMF